MAEKHQTEDTRRNDSSNKEKSSIRQDRSASSGSEKHKADFNKGGSTSKSDKRSEEGSANKGRNSI
jgi:hypothetical protein